MAQLSRKEDGIIFSKLNYILVCLALTYSRRGVSPVLLKDYCFLSNFGLWLNRLSNSVFLSKSKRVLSTYIMEDEIWIDRRNWGSLFIFLRWFFGWKIFNSVVGVFRPWHAFLLCCRAESLLSCIIHIFVCFVLSKRRRSDWLNKQKDFKNKLCWRKKFVNGDPWNLAGSFIDFWVWKSTKHQQS